MKRLIIGVGSALLVAIIVLVIYYNVSIGAVSKDETKIDFVIDEGTSVLKVVSMLDHKGLIKSKTMTKVYIKLNSINKIKAGVYEFDKTMGVKDIFNILEKGNNINPDSITVVIPEGKYLEQVADIFAAQTVNTKEKLLDVWASEEFVQTVIDKYDFVTDEVLNKDIRYPLEGYFFPASYEFINKEVTPEDIAYKLLDEMEKRLNKYKDLIDNSEFSVHEILTFASIIQYEAILEEDAYLISGVFHNRLEIGMKLESCATLDYALNTHKLIYTFDDMAVKSPYNTYYVDALPVGPGNMPGEISIKAVLMPKDNDYLFFLANVYDPNDKRTYYAKDYEGHKENIKEHLKK